MKQVRFTDDNIIIYEPLDIAADLQESRKSDFSRRMVDKLRMEKILSPILCKDHRNRIYSAIFSDVVSCIQTVEGVTLQ